MGFQSTCRETAQSQDQPRTVRLCGAGLEVVNSTSRSRKALAVVPNMANRSHLHAMTMIFKDLLRQAFFVVR
nr:MAG TPA: hypothetical protein [Caudoviricetes sp.]